MPFAVLLLGSLRCPYTCFPCPLQYSCSVPCGALIHASHALCSTPARFLAVPLYMLPMPFAVLLLGSLRYPYTCFPCPLQYSCSVPCGTLIHASHVLCSTPARFLAVPLYMLPMSFAVL